MEIQNNSKALVPFYEEEEVCEEGSGAIPLDEIDEEELHKRVEQLIKLCEENEALKREEERKKATRPTVFKMTCQATIGARDEIKQFFRSEAFMQAPVLQISMQTEEGWFSSTYMITVRGPRDRALAWCTNVKNRINRANQS